MTHDRGETAADSLGTAQETAPFDGFSAHPAAPVATAEPSPAWVTRQSAINILGGVLSQGLKFLVLVYVARRFSPGDFGIFSFAWAVNSFIYIAAHFGLPILGTRQGVGNGFVDGRMVVGIVVSRACLAIAGTMISLLLLFCFPRISAPELWLVFFFGLSNVAQAGFLDWAFQGLGRLEVSALLNVTWQALWLMFLFAGLRVTANLQMVGISLCLSGVVAATLSYGWLRRYISWTPAEGVGKLLRSCWRTLRSGGALGAATILLTVLVWSDFVIVRAFRGSEALAQYAAANRPEQALGLLLNFHLQGAFPLLTCASQSGRAVFERCFQRLYEDVATVFLPGVIWSLFYARPILVFIFGRQEYQAAGPLFCVFQGMFPLVMLTFLYGIGVLLVYHHDRAFLKVLRFTAGIFLVVCLAFTRLWGVYGAAWSNALCYLVSFVISVFASRHLVRPAHHRALVVPGLTGLTTGIVSKWMGLSLGPALALLVLAYAVLMAGRVIHRRSVEPILRPENA
jgi:O-antigen/teichoic acid export membrane protein